MVSATASHGTPPQSGLRRVVSASMAGTIVEWYEFFLYATAATLVFNLIMFPPSDDPYAGIIAAFVTYAVGFVARPSAASSSATSATSTVARSSCSWPSSSSAWRRSSWVPADLPAGRLLGAGAAGAAALRPGLRRRRRMGRRRAAGRRALPDKTRGFWASFPQAAVPIGNLVATVVLLVLSRTLSAEAFLAWGWRVGFWLSVVIVAIGYYIRTKISDAPIFLEAQKEAEEQKHDRYGVFEVVRRYPRGVLTAMGLRFAENIMYYLVVTFSITYLKIALDVTPPRSSACW
jgi:hypothetical protein